MHFRHPCILCRWHGRGCLSAIITLDDRLLQFLLDTYQPNTTRLKYDIALAEMVNHNSRLLVIDFIDIVEFDHELAREIIRRTEEILPTFNAQAFTRLRMIDPEYAAQLLATYHNDPKKAIQICFRGVLHDVPLRYVSDQVDQLVAARGIVTRITLPRPVVIAAQFTCRKCNERAAGHIDLASLTFTSPGVCPHCHSKVFALDKQSVQKIRYQEVTIEELPEDVEEGRAPAPVPVRLFGELVDRVIAGSHVTVSAIPKIIVAPEKNKAKAVLSIWLDANFIEDVDTSGLSAPTQDEIRQFHQEVLNPGFEQRMINSICPSLLGLQEVKQAVLYQMIRGVDRFHPDGTYRRGFWHILIVGDPSLGKTTLLMYVASVTPHAQYVSGLSASGRGLTAAVTKDENGVMALTAGALVLANGSTCCMDENTRLYVGDALIPVRELFPDKYVTTSAGQQIGQVFVPLQSFRTMRNWEHVFEDEKGYARQIIRRPYHGKLVALTFSSGLVLRVTPDHLIRSTNKYHNKWIPAGKLHTGQKIKCPKSLFAPLIPFSIPSKTAYLMGFIYGDGNFGLRQGKAPRIEITQAESNHAIVQQLSDFQELQHYAANPVPRLITARVTADKSKEYAIIEQQHKFYTADKYILEVFATHFSKLQNILALDDDALCAFFAGLFDSDGNIDHNHGKVIQLRLYATADKSQLEILWYALKRLGIRTGQSESRGFPILNITGHNITKFMGKTAEWSVKIKREERNPLGTSVRKKSRLAMDEEEIRSVSTHDYDGWVYDVTMLGIGQYAHAFMAGGIYIHNCIDESEKMDKSERVMIHEPLETGELHVSKGGFNTRLGAHTSGLFAANPAFGRYDIYKNLADNVSLPITLLSRMDQVFILRDSPDAARDLGMIRHILNADAGITPVTATNASPAAPAAQPPFEPDFIRKFVVYARTFQPRLTPEANTEIENYYLKMRQLPTEDSPLFIASRQGQAIIRMAECRAKLHLRNAVTVQDVTAATNLMSASLNQAGFDVNSGKVDIDTIMTGKPQSTRNAFEMIFDAFEKIKQSTGNDMVKEDDVIASVAKNTGAPDYEIKHTLHTLVREGFFFAPQSNYIQRLK